MKFVLFSVTSANEPWAEAARTLYVKKINPYTPFEIKDLKNKKSARDEKSRKVLEESKALLEQLSKDDFVILFDERGRDFTSTEFSKKIEHVLQSGKKRCVFIIGGAFGVDDSIKSRADLTVSFSKMVMNHLVAETVALEQIYRAFTIIKNIPYHNN